jgi:hypothetical protein
MGELDRQQEQLREAHRSREEEQRRPSRNNIDAKKPKNAQTHPDH